MNEAVPSFAEIISGARVIPLTKAKFAIVDAEDYDWLTSLGGWYISCGYAARYVEKINGKVRLIRMHQLLTRCGRKEQVDHRNYNRLDNRRWNLRPCTKSQNMMNRGATKSSSTGLKGVTFEKQTQRWKAQIMVDYKNINLGKFDTPEEAHAAYCEAAKKHHGEFFRAS